jgi:hypothetical protein
MEKNESSAAPRPNSTVSLESRIQILLEEYRALYSLLTFRLTAMDRHLPAIGGTLAGILGSTTAMPDQARLSFLLGLPIAVLWLFLSTVQHARSKEDHVRRIDEIERLVNRLAGEELLVFQSRHPNKARHAGGRTGFGSVIAVLSVCLIMLGLCLHTVQTPRPLLTHDKLATYAVYLSGCAVLMLAATIRLSRYRYHRPPPDGPTIFFSHRLDSA